MKTKFSKIGLTLIGLMSFVSCEQDALVEPPAFEKKPAIMCLMSPQSMRVEASVAYTKPYYGLQKDETEFISDALLVLIDEKSGLSDTFRNYAPGMYDLNFYNINLIESQWYTLRVRMNDGKEYNARAQVPPKPELSKFEIASVKMGTPYEDIKNGGWGSYILNPYAVEFRYDLRNPNFYVSPQLEGIARNSRGEEISVRVSFADEILAGNAQSATSFFSQSEFYSGFGIEGPFQLDSFYGAIYTMDKAYRDYYKMQMLQGADNPFAEPVLFTNNFTEGALGVFGCYDYVKGTFVY